MKVIYFDIDTLRPDHLSCCGYGRPTPHIDALAADGVRFSRAYASNTPCMPARAALFTGCFGVVNGVETHGTAALSVATPPETALPRVLSWEGVHTAAVSSFGRHPAPWFYNGFSHVPFICMADQIMSVPDGGLVNERLRRKSQRVWMCHCQCWLSIMSRENFRNWRIQVWT